MALRKFTCAILTIILVLQGLFVVPVNAVSVTVPKYISYSGQLTDSDDEALSGSYSMVFTIYDTLIGGSSLWTETQTITVTNGFFSASLGSETALTLDFDKQYWISLNVSSDGEMSPRQPVNSVAYSYVSDVAYGAYVTTTAPTASAGLLYYDTDDGNLYVYDAIQSSWVDATATTTDGTTEDAIRRWNGTSWVEETSFNVDSSGNVSSTADIVLRDSSSDIQILESSGGTYFGKLDVGDLSADSTFTFSGGSGTVLTSDNYDDTLDNIYLLGSGNLSGISSTSTARSNLELSQSDIPEFAGIAVTGDVTSTESGIDWDLVDNTSEAISFDSVGKTGIMSIVTFDGSEGVVMSGTLNVQGTTNFSSDILTTGAAIDWDIIGNTSSALSFDSSSLDGLLEFDTTTGHERIMTSGDLLVTGTTTLSATTIADDVIFDFVGSNDYWISEFASEAIMSIGRGSTVGTNPIMSFYGFADIVGIGTSTLSAYSGNSLVVGGTLAIEAGQSSPPTTGDSGLVRVFSDDQDTLKAIFPDNSVESLIDPFTEASNAVDEYNTEHRFGFGTTTPHSRLHVQGLGGFEDDESFTGSFLPTGWTSPGTSNVIWTKDTGTGYEDSASAKSGTITASQTSYLEYTVTYPSLGDIEFWWKVSSEENYDKLVFCYDPGTCTISTGQSQESISGEVGWARVVYPVTAGEHTFRWLYGKDPSVDTGSDAGWVDNISFNVASTTAAAFIVDGKVGIGTTTPVGMLHIEGDYGVVVGNPTGGDKGAGTINAGAVYDDNSQLSDYVFDKYFDGVVRDEDQDLHGEYEILSLDQLGDFVEENRHLPTIEGREEWKEKGGFSLGALASQLWQTTETNALYITELNTGIEEQKIALESMGEFEDIVALLDEKYLQLESDLIAQMELTDNKIAALTTQDLEFTTSIDALQLSVSDLQASTLDFSSSTNISVTSVIQDVSSLHDIDASIFSRLLEVESFVSTTNNTIVEPTISVEETSSTDILAGAAKIISGFSGVEIAFDAPFSLTPIITVTQAGGSPTPFVLADISKSGFKIDVIDYASSDILFNWIVAAVEEPELHVSNGATTAYTLSVEELLSEQGPETTIENVDPEETCNTCEEEEETVQSEVDSVTSTEDILTPIIEVESTSTTVDVVEDQPEAELPTVEVDLLTVEPTVIEEEQEEEVILPEVEELIVEELLTEPEEEVIEEVLEEVPEEIIIEEPVEESSNE
jgi:hypothetical protein